MSSSDARRKARTPFTWLEKRVRFNRPALRWAALVAVAASVLIIVTGGIVRVTGSGLGCPTWPSCRGEGFAPTAEMGIHGVIEFGNRLLTGLLCVVVGWLIVVARLQRQPVPQVTRWAWAQFWIILLNALVGGITVLARLSPYIVAAHFLAATLLLAAATVAWHKAGQLDAPPTTDNPDASVHRIGAVLLVSTAVLLIAGTLVTGTGPHAGDSSDVARMPFDWTAVTFLHGIIAVLVGGTAVTLWIKVRTAANPTMLRRITLFLAVFLAQGLVGIVQVVTALPEVAVVLHLLGSAFVWIGAIRVYFDTRSSHLSGSEQAMCHPVNGAVG